MDISRFQSLLDRARANAGAATRNNINNLAHACAQNGVTQIDLTSLQIGNPDEVGEAVVDTLREILSSNPRRIGLSNREGAPVSAPPSEHSSIQNENGIHPAKHGIVLNSKQAEFVSTALGRRDCILIGAAGTGKTTCQRDLTAQLVSANALTKISAGTKYLAAGTAGAVICSFTRKAVNNIKKNVHPDLQANVLTMHRLLEFEPEFFTIADRDDPTKLVRSMRFIPQRNSANPLPPEITLVIYEEASMIGTELYNLFIDALPHQHQEIFLGDLQQLPPVFGQAILGFKLLEHPVIELTEIYRQGEGSPIINLCHAILEGKTEDFSCKLASRIDTQSGKRKNYCPALEQHTKKNSQGEVKLQIWQRSLDADTALNSAVQQFIAWSAAKPQYYNHAEDIILCPFNKAFGTVELNKKLSQYFGKQRGAVVHEVIAGFQKHYLAVGDRVLYDKEDAFIVAIEKNGRYLSAKMPQPASPELDRWGHLRVELTPAQQRQALLEQSTYDLGAIDSLLEDLDIDTATERTTAASHTVTIRYPDAAEDGSADIHLDQAAQINSLLGGYAITVHKAQGSEYKNVFLLLHSSHGVMNSRELLYTACSRARERLHIICEPTSFERGITAQRVKGDTIEEKAQVFKGKLDGTEIGKRWSLVPTT